ncbi:IS110 family transposase, partial [Streptomyces sp. NPDC005227]
TINNALHMIAVTQVRGDGEGAAYYAKQIAVGRTVKEALRLLKRRISDRIFRALLADESAQRVQVQPATEVVELAA